MALPFPRQGYTLQRAATYMQKYISLSIHQNTIRVVRSNDNKIEGNEKGKQYNGVKKFNDYTMVKPMLPKVMATISFSLRTSAEGYTGKSILLKQV